MKKIVLIFITLLSFACLSPILMAQESTAKVITIINPRYSNNIQVADVLKRTVMIEVNPESQILKESIPKSGANRDGIELNEILLKSQASGNKKIYTITLTYQVFAISDKPAVMRLPEETFAFNGGAHVLSLKVPAWNFWFSPLVPEGLGNAKDNLQPQYPPPSISLQSHLIKLAVSLALLVIGFVGVIYMNANISWVPFMNGEFAKVCRQLSKLPNKQGREQLAFSYLHQAFNHLHGAILFANEIDQFIKNHPHFSALENEIKVFFEDSNIALFSNQQGNGDQKVNDLIILSKQLRSCERGVR
jgi:mxaA protein